MQSKKISANQEIDISEYYSLKIRSLWSGLKQESVAFWFLCIYVFFEYVRPQTIYPWLDSAPWAQISLLTTLFFALIDKKVVWVKNPQNKLVLLFYILVFLSSVFAFDPSISWEKFKIVIGWVMVYFLIITIVNTEKRMFIFILLFLIVSFKMSQFGFRVFAGRGFAFAEWGLSGAPGWFQNSSEFGVQMAIFVPLAIAFIIALKQYWGRYKRWFFYLLPFTGLISIIGSSSRGAQLAIAVVGVWFLLKSKWGIKGLIVIMVVGWLGYSLIPPEQLGRFQTMGDDRSSASRLSYWKFGLEVMQEKPILGDGYDNFIIYCWHKNPDGIGPYNACQAPHNSLVEIGADNGLIALAIYFIMVILIFKSNAQTRRIAKNTDRKFAIYIAYGLDGGMIGYLVSSFFLATAFYPFFWFQLAMVVALYQVTKKRHESSPEQPKSYLQQNIKA